MLDKIKDQLKIYRTSGEKYKRFGPTGDGGYVMVDDITENDFVISCGIGDDKIWDSRNIEWEKDILSFCNYMHMYECADIKNTLPKSELFKGFVGKDFYLDSMLANTKWEKDFITKIDIEGGEWPLFAQAKTKEIGKFRQIVIEFHDFAERIRSDSIATLKTLIKLNRTHKIAYINENLYGSYEHINNFMVPNIIEVLFLRKSSYGFVNVDYPESLLNSSNTKLNNITPFYRYG
jgi:hypothetical protein